MTDEQVIFYYQLANGRDLLPYPHIVEELRKFAEVVIEKNTPKKLYLVPALMEQAGYIKKPEGYKERLSWTEDYIKEDK